MKNAIPSSADLDRLPLPERNLVEQVCRSCSHDQKAVSLGIAELRLRNIIEKYSDELKRARLAGRSGASTQGIYDLQCRLDICRRALETCRENRAGLGDGT